MNGIYRRKNDAAENTGLALDTEQPDAVEEELSEVGEKVQQIRVLISRHSELSHYRAFDDIELIIEAIGNKDYPGSPNLDVLPSQECINRERRDKIKEYIYCISCWVDSKDLEDVIGEFKVNEKLLRNTYIHLGELDEEKKWLASCLVDSLSEEVFSPEDVVCEIPDEDFILHAYRTILDREPDDDDFRLRLIELKRGKTHEELIRDILESRENSRRMLAEIANSIKTPSSEI